MYRIVESLHCTSETNSMLYVNYTGIEIKNIKNLKKNNNSIMKVAQVFLSKRMAKQTVIYSCNEILIGNITKLATNAINMGES